jgi:hypothetical protein
MATQAQEDGYVECAECGHPVEQHDTGGCDPCRQGGVSLCLVKWTKTEIRNLRRREGLPAAYSPGHFTW